MFNPDRDSVRQVYFTAWKKYQMQQPLERLERQIVEVISIHPEYHPMLEQADCYRDKEFFPEMGENNPFLHLGLHMGLREQIDTNRPAGIAAVFKKLCVTQSSHEVEHKMMECLAEMLWLGQKNQSMPDESTYLNLLMNLE